MCRSFRAPVFTPGFFDNIWMTVGVAVAYLFIILGLYLPGLQDLLELTGLNGGHWAMVVVGTAVHMLVVEAEKWAMRHWNITIN
jgi:hypothetical protein